MSWDLIHSLPTVLGASATVPPLLALWLIVALDRRPEPPLMVWGAFLLGVASIFAARYARIPFEHFVQPHDATLPAAALQALFLAAIPEETVKLLAIAFIATRRAFNEPMDGVVYGAAVGLGFATYENLSYLVQHEANWQTLAAVRSVLTVPFHAAMGVIAGSLIAHARFGSFLSGHHHSRFSYARLLAEAWIVTVVLHALYDTPLLALRYNLAGEGIARTLTQFAGIGIGTFGIWIAWRRAWRIHAHQHREHGPRAPAHAWQAVWLLLIASAAACFVGAALLASQIRTLHAGGDVLFAWLASSMMLLLIGLAGFLYGRRHLLTAEAP